MSTEPAANEPKGFPFVTVGASLGVLFAFLALTVIAYRSPNYLAPAKAPAKAAEPALDAASKLSEVRIRNENALGGVGAKMPADVARQTLIGKLKGPTDALEFPTPEPPPPPPAKKDEPKKDEPKKDEPKKDEKAKQ